MKIGFIGLGHLGKAIANRLIACDHWLTVWNRTPEKVGDIKAEIADTPAAVADNSRVIFICLFDSNAVKSVLTQDAGLLSGDLSGKIIVDLSTNHFQAVDTFYTLCSEKGAVYLEVPVLGSVVPAAKGAVTLVVSGDKKGYETVRPVLEDLGKHIFYLGDQGLATKMKLLNNLTLGSFMATIAEVLAMAETLGMDKKDILDILSVGGGDSLVLTAKKEKLIGEDFSTHFSNALIYKDLHCLQDLAYTQKTSLFSGALVKELYARTFEMGIDQEDFSAIYKVFKKE